MGARQSPGHTEVILLLCSANVARSPLAAALLRHRLDQIGRSDVVVSSAGLEATAGTSACLEACQVAEARGLDLSAHVASGVARAKLTDTALVLTMTEAQRAAAARHLPSAISRTFTLTELARLLGSSSRQFDSIAELAWHAHSARPRTEPAETAEDVADPIDRPMRHYHRTADYLGRLVDQLTEHVRPRVPATSV